VADIAVQVDRDAGFTLLEVLIASLLALIVIGGLAALAHPARLAAEVQPEAIDVQQRARFGVASLYRDIYSAGAGMDAGPATGTLRDYLPPILPRRIGALRPDSANTARTDVITLISVPATPAQSRLLVPLAAGVVTLEDMPGCPIGSPACGLRNNMGALVFDRSGHFDLFTVLDVVGPAATLRLRGTSSGHVYGAGSFVAEVDARTYYFDAAARQLRRYDTDSTDVPVIDDVTNVRVTYYGSPIPPAAPRPLPGEVNCLYDDGGSLRPGLLVLPGGPDGQALLPLSLFTDGPWCGDGGTAFDADLLRIRRVSITVRFQATSVSYRGTGLRFGAGGTSQSALRSVPDLVLSFDVSPRNLDVED
jgi:Prokaryotic N-terminal methylation motif